MAGLLLFFHLLLGVNAFICPNGFTDGGDGSCYTGIVPYSQTFKNDAYQDCARRGGYPFDVPNAFANTNIQQMGQAAKVQYDWLGLTCLTPDVASCQWDTGVNMNRNSYNNFARGTPDPLTGACVVLEVSTGHWLMADCSSYAANYGCKYTPGVDIRKFNTTWNQCPYGGVAASIHTPGQNSFILGLAGRQLVSPYLMLGLNYSSNLYTWADGSPFNYTNWGYQNVQLGNCVSMAIVNTDIPVGTWINSPCSNDDSTVTVICRQDSAPIVPTVSPPYCGGPQFLNGSGTLYSPGYPRTSEANSCVFIITEDSGQQVQLQFNVLQLGEDSSISLYNNVLDKTPFLTLTDTRTPTLVVSPSNLLKVVFNTTASPYYTSYWTADYGVYYSTTPTTTTTMSSLTSALYVPGCNNWYGSSGEISNYYYPYTYTPGHYYCYFYLQPSLNRTCLAFKDFHLRSGDSICLYDTIKNQKMITEFTNTSQPILGQYYCAGNSGMTVALKVNSGDSSVARGFDATFQGFS